MMAEAESVPAAAKDGLATPPTPMATVVLSGGAPNGSLTAGALCAIYDQGKTFTTFYTSGAGGTFGLLFVAAAKGKPANEALRNVLKAGIDDAIYKFVPLGYKTFFKRGPFTVPFKRFGDKLKDPDTQGGFYNDLVDLCVAAITPTTLNFKSPSLCAQFPFLHELIDFERLKKFDGGFFMNAYSIDDGYTLEFSKDEIGQDHFFASLAFPFIYPPTRVLHRGKPRYFYEGSAWDPLNLKNIIQRLRSEAARESKAVERPRLDPLQPLKPWPFGRTIVIIDVLGALKKDLVRQPRDVLDAYGISIVMPVASLAEKCLDLFNCELEHLDIPDDQKPQVIKLEFDLDAKDGPTAADWSRSNLERLFEIGYRAGSRFCEKYGALLPNRTEGSSNPETLSHTRREGVSAKS
jgi:predicted acylesterase/phospholipase RssA